MSEAVRKSGSWVVCHSGCTGCCIGPFPITMLDAARLRTGLATLEAGDPARAGRIRERAETYIARLPYYPGDLTTGVLDESTAGADLLDALAEEDPCPVLN